MRDTIVGILRKYYGKMYGDSLCEAMADVIVRQIEAGVFTTRQDVMLYVWMNTSGGGVAEMMAEEMQKALPDVIADSDKQTR